MSGGLFGYTSFFSQTQNFNPDESLKEGAGYGLLKYETEPNYEETKRKNDLYGYLTQPTTIHHENPLEPFKINSIGRETHPTYGLNASYYNGLLGKVNDKPFGTEVFFPKAYPDHFYNPYKNSPTYLGISSPSYPI